MHYDKTKTWDLLLLAIRLWLAFAMIKSGNCVIDIFTSEKERQFFEQWFGNELHFPLPLLMAVLAKGSEFVGGILAGIGCFTRVAAGFIAFTMLVATLTANLGENFNVDGGFTISYCLFALILVVWGSGRFGLDGWRRARFKN